MGEAQGTLFEPEFNRSIKVQTFSQKITSHAGALLLRERLVAKRDQRRDGFVRVLAKAAQTKLGDDADSVVKQLLSEGIPRHLARDATEIARKQGSMTIFALVDALTRLTQNTKFVSDRAKTDAKVAALLALAA